MAGLQFGGGPRTFDTNNNGITGLFGRRVLSGGGTTFGTNDIGVTGLDFSGTVLAIRDIHLGTARNIHFGIGDNRALCLPTGVWLTEPRARGYGTLACIITMARAQRKLTTTSQFEPKSKSDGEEG